MRSDHDSPPVGASQVTIAPNWAAVGAILGGLSVVLGAFGAHGLKGRFAQLTAGEFRPGDAFDLGVRYLAIHALAILFASLLANDQRGGRLASASCWTFLLGVAVFSGTLCLLGVTGMRWLGAVTPIGGVALIVGWAFLAASAFGLGRSGEPSRT